MKMKKEYATLGLALVLAGCGGGQAVTQPGDTTLSQDMDTAKDAVGLERLAVAEQQYRAAGQRAVARDDVTAIGDAGYNLATVQLDEGKPQDALSTVTATRSALAMRGQTGDDSGLDLVQAGALHRLGRETEAAAAASRAAGAQDTDIVEKAQLIRGLIADDSGDQATLASVDAYFANLTGKLPDSWTADAKEIAARNLLVTGGSTQTAMQDAMQAATIRQTQVDYRDMARALGVAGRAAAKAGNAQAAAQLYARASQSALQAGDKTTAAQWAKLAGTTSAVDPFALPATATTKKK
ncbi:hypothetical protein [Komagataeibacter oboediens]|uniref:Tetratricopeptide repeat-like domain-containing protein n=1 Tax=Komagataeibacter oboediens TaxID=65958 RepID=A0A318QS79_9PROT|nr:hypothetical protein [Komagataeibacter oboediens]MBL7232822.1 hypothetical protein [Komagataeibacter oboediens]MBT0675565.1 hypothetical protein [Komagataeibacter oboediens]MBT0679058.1 hypothetical protein [Komagataeibacter oboediens]PYD82416.1 hypothetical protein CFR80_06535 [Komagataeibacter oboediens]